MIRDCERQLNCDSCFSVILWISSSIVALKGVNHMVITTYLFRTKTNQDDFVLAFSRCSLRLCIAVAVETFGKFAICGWWADDYMSIKSMVPTLTCSDFRLFLLSFRTVRLAIDNQCLMDKFGARWVTLWAAYMHDDGGHSESVPSKTAVALSHVLISYL